MLYQKKGHAHAVREVIVSIQALLLVPLGILRSSVALLKCWLWSVRVSVGCVPWLPFFGKYFELNSLSPVFFSRHPPSPTRDISSGVSKGEVPPPTRFLTLYQWNCPVVTSLKCALAGLQTEPRGLTHAKQGFYNWTRSAPAGSSWSDFCSEMLWGNVFHCFMWL